MKNFDIVVIGAGQAGPTLAKTLANAGRKVALIERKQMGGSCVNFGCTPTKAALASARIIHLAQHADSYGIQVRSVQANFPVVLARAGAFAKDSRESMRQHYSHQQNLELICAHARFIGKQGDSFRLSVGDEEISAQDVVLDTGTRSAVPPIAGLETITYIDAENWLEHTTLPQHLAIIGGGYIGLEMAQFYRRMGAAVTIIESASQVAGQEDADVAAALQNLLEQEGVSIRLNAKATQFKKTPDGVTVVLDGADGKTELDVSTVFLALGRKPNTDDLGLENIGLQPDRHGVLKVDQRSCTEVEGVWAVGDIRGGPMFTHTAWDDYRIVASQLIGDGTRTTDRVVPYAVFTDPSLGRVGITEAQAREAGMDIKVAHYPMQKNGKANEIGASDGFVKLIVDASNQRLLGAAVLAVEGAELVHVYVAMMNAKTPYPVLKNAMMIHPTLAEALQSALTQLT